MATPRGALETLQALGTPARTEQGAAVVASVTGRTAGSWRPWLVLVGWRLLLTAALLLAWEVAATTVTTPFWISQPSRVFGRLVSLTESGLLFWHVAATLQAALLGLALGGVGGVALGLALGARPRIAEIVDPLLMGLNSLP